MPIKSSFLPKEGLQGEEIPSHITWEKLDYDTLLLNLPNFLCVKEIYNANRLNDFNNKKNLEIGNTDIDVDGYLGLLFESSRSKDDGEVNGTVIFSFLKNNEVVYCIKKDISLYRPLIKSIDTPPSITISFPEKKVSDKISLQNIGDATSVLGIITTEESEIEEALSDDQQKFIEEFNKCLQDEVEFLKEMYPNYESLLNRFLQYEINPKLDSKEITEELEQVILNDKLFSTSFFDSIQRVLMSNMKFKTLIDNFIAYNESLANSKILIFNPFSIVEISEKPKTICIKLVQSDLLLNEYDSILLNPIEISANKKGNIELYKLFNWGENGPINQ